MLVRRVLIIIKKLKDYIEKIKINFKIEKMKQT